MKRLTTDNPSNNFETMLNFVYGKDGWAHIRHDGENADVPLTEWARKRCSKEGCMELPERPEDLDAEICDCAMRFPDCLIALAYCFASQAVHMRSRLKMYEDILFAEDGTELASLDDLRELIKVRDNPPLTLEELQAMDGEPVWLFPGGCWVLVTQNPITSLFTFSDGNQCVGEDWLTNVGKAYRRKPEEGDNHG
ncbi:MAG: hypothetical protein HDT20_04370 [Oscillibacter sp.]|nr:hypothetical protein [Oscillibacter sp.]